MLREPLKTNITYTEVLIMCITIGDVHMSHCLIPLDPCKLCNKLVCKVTQCLSVVSICFYVCPVISLKRLLIFRKAIFFLGQTVHYFTRCGTYKTSTYPRVDNTPPPLRKIKLFLFCNLNQTLNDPKSTKALHV